MKGRDLIGIALLLVSSLVLGGCADGVSQEDYEAIVAERDTARAEVVTLQSELASLERKMARAKALAEVVNSLFVPALTGELEQISENESMRYFQEWRDKVEASGDPLAQDKFETLIESRFPDEQMRDFFLYLFEVLLERLE